MLEWRFSMELKPSKIRYSQDSIARTFGKSTRHPFRPIGQTLDDILSGQCNVNSIPAISVEFRGGHWFTADNRRLWVFQKAEERGRCDKISVNVVFGMDETKFTTTNEGRYVSVRGDPGGYYWRRCPKVRGRSTEYSYEGLSSYRSPSHVNRPPSTSSLHVKPTTYEAYPAYHTRPASYTRNYSTYDYSQQEASPNQRNRSSESTTNSSFWDLCIILWTVVMPQLKIAVNYIYFVLIKLFIYYPCWKTCFMHYRQQKIKGLLWNL